MRLQNSLIPFDNERDAVSLVLQVREKKLFFCFLQRIILPFFDFLKGWHSSQARLLRLRRSHRLFLVVGGGDLESFFRILFSKAFFVGLQHPWANIGLGSRIGAKRDEHRQQLKAFEALLSAEALFKKVLQMDKLQTEREQRSLSQQQLGSKGEIGVALVKVLAFFESKELNKCLFLADEVVDKAHEDHIVLQLAERLQNALV